MRAETSESKITCVCVSLLQVSKELEQLKDINVELAYDGLEVKVKL
jgi:hypothetical protein